MTKTDEPPGLIYYLKANGSGAGREEGSQKTAPRPSRGSCDHINRSPVAGPQKEARGGRGSAGIPVTPQSSVGPCVRADTCVCVCACDPNPHCVLPNIPTTLPQPDPLAACVQQ